MKTEVHVSIVVQKYNPWLFSQSPRNSIITSITHTLPLAFYIMDFKHFISNFECLIRQQQQQQQQQQQPFSPKQVGVG
jgi:hypothetical protein